MCTSGNPGQKQQQYMGPMIFMPYNNNTASQSELYMETLDVLSQSIESTAGNTPYLVIVDMKCRLTTRARYGEELVQLQALQ